MSLQYVWDLSNKIQVNRRKLSAVQMTRSEIVRTELSVTKNPWKFTVSVPGMPWNQMRGIIESIEALGRTTPSTVTVGNNANFSWMYRYQGDAASTPTGLTVSSFTGNQLVVGNLSGLSLSSSQYVFRAGDMVQVVGRPYPFTVVSDVLRGSGTTVTVTTHRPNVIASMPSSPTLNVGKNCQISLVMAEQPVYSLSPGARRMANGSVINNAIVEWDGDFKLVEYLYQ